MSNPESSSGGKEANKNAWTVAMGSNEYGIHIPMPGEVDYHQSNGEVDISAMDIPAVAVTPAAPETAPSTPTMESIEVPQSMPVAPKAREGEPISMPSIEDIPTPATIAAGETVGKPAEENVMPSIEVPEIETAGSAPAEEAETAEKREISTAEYNRIAAGFTHIADFYKYQSQLGLPEEQAALGIVGMEEWSDETMAKYMELVKAGGSRVDYEGRTRKHLEEQGLSYTAPETGKSVAERMSEAQSKLVGLSDYVSGDEGITNRVAEMIRKNDVDGLEQIIAEAEAAKAAAEAAKKPEAPTPAPETPTPENPTSETPTPETPTSTSTPENPTPEGPADGEEFDPAENWGPENPTPAAPESGSQKPERFEKISNFFRKCGKKIVAAALAVGLVFGGIAIAKNLRNGNAKPEMPKTTYTQTIDGERAVQTETDNGSPDEEQDPTEEVSEKKEAMERMGSHLGRWAERDGSGPNHLKNGQYDFDDFDGTVGEFGNESLDDDGIKQALFETSTQLDATIAGSVLRAVHEGVSFDGVTEGMTDDQIEEKLRTDPDFKKATVERLAQIMDEGTLSRATVSGKFNNEYVRYIGGDGGYMNPDNYDMVQSPTNENDTPVYIINFEGADLMYKYMCAQPITYVEVPGIPDIPTFVVTTPPPETTTTTTTTETTPKETTTTSTETTPKETTTTSTETTPKETTTTSTETTPKETTTTSTETTPKETTTTSTETTPKETTTTSTETTPKETTPVETTNVPKNTDAEADAAGQASQEYVTTPIIVEPQADGQGYYDPNTGSWVNPGEQPGVSFENIGQNGQSEPTDVSGYDNHDASGNPIVGDYDQAAAQERANQAEEDKARQEAANNNPANSGEAVTPVDINVDPNFNNGGDDDL